MLAFREERLAPTHAPKTQQTPNGPPHKNPRPEKTFLLTRPVVRDLESGHKDHHYHHHHLSRDVCSGNPRESSGISYTRRAIERALASRFSRRAAGSSIPKRAPTCRFFFSLKSHHFWPDRAAAAGARARRSHRESRDAAILAASGSGTYEYLCATACPTATWCESSLSLPLPAHANLLSPPRTANISQRVFFRSHSAAP